MSIATALSRLRDIRNVMFESNSESALFEGVSDSRVFESCCRDVATIAAAFPAHPNIQFVACDTMANAAVLSCATRPGVDLVIAAGGVPMAVAALGACPDDLNVQSMASFALFIFVAEGGEPVKQAILSERGVIDKLRRAATLLAASTAQAW